MSINCDCGYQADSPEDLTDHIIEMFTPEDDMGPDGQVHAQAARGVLGADGMLACLCGFTGAPGDLDEHFLHVFVSADRVGRDGMKHLTGQVTVAQPLDRLGASAESCVFADDMEENLVPAYLMGMTVIYSLDEQETSARLRQLLGLRRC